MAALKFRLRMAQSADAACVRVMNLNMITVRVTVELIDVSQNTVDEAEISLDERR